MPSTITRRSALQLLGAASVLPALHVRRAPAAEGVVLNDVHSALNETRVAGVRPVASIEDVVRAIGEARARGIGVSIAGGRHAMGGQQFGAGTLNLDTRPMDGIHAFDRERGIVDVGAGIQWPELVAELRARQPGERRPWTIVQKQTGADRLCLGGALSANVHGRGLALRPIVGDVESFTLVDAAGRVHECSRSKNPELFRVAIGGYGLFGVITSVRLRLARRRKLERVVEIRSADEILPAFAKRIRQGCLHGDFQFETNERSPTFLTRGVFAAYRPVADEVPETPSPRELSYEDWMGLLHLGHTDKARAFDLYAEHYLATSGQVYASDTSQLSLYPDGYHRALDARSGAAARGSEMITELYVPRLELPGFLAEAAVALRAARAHVIYGTVRLIEADDETFLPWARQAWACVVLNLHVEHTRAGREHARRAFRLLIDLAQSRGGSYYLTYHRWATRGQLLRSYPQFPEFLRLKRAHDPDDVFRSDWVLHHRRLLADATPAAGGSGDPTASGPAPTARGTR